MKERGRPYTSHVANEIGVFKPTFSKILHKQDKQTSSFTFLALLYFNSLSVFVYILNIALLQLLVYLLLYFLLLLLFSISPLTPDEDYESKALVFLIVSRV